MDRDPGWGDAVAFEVAVCCFDVVVFLSGLDGVDVGAEGLREVDRLGDPE